MGVSRFFFKIVTPARIALIVKNKGRWNGSDKLFSITKITNTVYLLTRTPPPFDLECKCWSKLCSRSCLHCVETDTYFSTDVSCTLRHRVHWMSSVRTYTLPCIWINPWRRRTSAHFICMVKVDVNKIWKFLVGWLRGTSYTQHSHIKLIQNVCDHYRNQKRSGKSPSEISPQSTITTSIQSAIVYFWWKHLVPCRPHNCRSVPNPDISSSFRIYSWSPSPDRVGPSN